MTLGEVTKVLNCDRLKIKEEETCSTLLDIYNDLVTGGYCIPKELLDREVVSIGVGLENYQIVLWISGGIR